MSTGQKEEDQHTQLPRVHPHEILKDRYRYSLLKSGLLTSTESEEVFRPPAGEAVFELKCVAPAGTAVLAKARFKDRL